MTNWFDNAEAKIALKRLNEYYDNVQFIQLLDQFENYAIISFEMDGFDGYDLALIKYIDEDQRFIVKHNQFFNECDNSKIKEQRINDFVISCENKIK